jgi:hypothetical protein
MAFSSCTGLRLPELASPRLAVLALRWRLTGEGSRELFSPHSLPLQLGIPFVRFTPDKDDTNLLCNPTGKSPSLAPSDDVLALDLNEPELARDATVPPVVTLFGSAPVL